MEVIPDVARSWEVLKGGREYLFHLGDDVFWTDGTAVTASDFVYAWRRALDPATEAPLASLLYDIQGARAFHQGETQDPGRVGVQALDDFTLSVTLERPASYFLHLLTQPLASPVPAHVIEACGNHWTEAENLVTNGPFHLETWQRGNSMTLARNPAYHGRFTGNVHRLQVFFTPPDRPASLTLYEQGDLDVTGLMPADVDRARREHPDEYLTAPWLATTWVGFDASRPPFDDRRVRRAFALATDKQPLANVVRRGYYSPAIGGFVPQGMPGHVPGISPPYDPTEAQRLLKDAGFPEGRGFPKIKALAVSAFQPESEYLRSLWRELLGIDVAWSLLDWSEFDERRIDEIPNIYLAGWVADYADPDNFLRVALSYYWDEWPSERYGQLVEKARRVMDQDERLELYRQADQMLQEEALIVPLTYRRFHYLVKPWVRKFPTSVRKAWFWKDVVIEQH